MSKKNFVTIALSLNVIICAILCVLYFNGYGEKDWSDTDKADTTKNMAESNIQDTTKGNQHTMAEPDSTEEADSAKETNTTKEPGTTKKSDTVKEPDTTTESGNTKEPGTTKTPETTREPVTTKEPESTTNNPLGGEQTTIPEYLEGKTTAVIIGDCNVRDASGVSGNVIGVVRVGEEYVIDRSKSTKDWIALVYNGSFGYIYIDYCTLK